MTLNVSEVDIKNVTMVSILREFFLSNIPTMPQFKLQTQCIISD